MESPLITISSDSVKAKTGKTWEDWKLYLDKAGMIGKSHKEIVQYLHAKYHLGSWWDQMVTNSYEKMSGRRVVGQTTGADFQIDVQRTFNTTLKKAWDIIISLAGRETWLGHTSTFALKVREMYRTTDGTTGEVRAVEEERHIRITWQPLGWKKTSTIQIRIIRQGDRTVVSFHQEGLSRENERQEMKDRWVAVLDTLQQLMEK